MSMLVWVFACLFLGCATPKRLDRDRAPERPGVTPSPPKRLDLDRTPERADGIPSPVLEAMRAELARSLTELRARGDPPPYYMAYEVIDLHLVDIAAEFGALLESDEMRRRELDVDVRVGSPKLDNTHVLRDSERFSRRFETARYIPVEDDSAALRAALWLMTDQRYMEAVERLVKIKSERAINAPDEDSSDDFSEDKPTVFVGVPATLEFDRGVWEQRIRSLSSTFRDRPEIIQGKVQLRVSAETRTIASSEGAALQRGSTHARLILTVQAKADDGMDLELNDTADASSVAKLPDEAALRGRARSLVDRIIALRAAPVAEPYLGPAILDGRAASVFFHETFGHRVEGHRQKDDEEGQTFAKKINQRVMPSFVEVWDDPSVRALNGVELNGWYPFDDEGIGAQRALLVEKGILKGFLMSRAPARGLTHSNGHGRRAPGGEVVARQANLVVDPVSVSTPEHLKQLLLSEVAKQGKPYGLRFAEVEGGYTTTARSEIQAFKVQPVVVYRVYPDGREELVRGVNLEGTPLTSLSTILAAGNDFAVFNGFCGAESGLIPVSASSPSLLVGQIEVARKEKAREKPPILPPPPFTPASSKGGAR